MTKLLLYIIVGFVAQMISGTLGMAYGVSGTLFLLSIGLPTSIASASIHSATVVTSLVSGISHFFAGNVDKKIFLRLLIPGAAGGIIGSILLSNFDCKILKPLIYTYLFIMGIRIIAIALKETQIMKAKIGGKIYIVGFVAGILDALGGGGWGPIMTTTMISKGFDTRKTVGTVNASKFIVALVQVITFSIFLTISHWSIILGLIIGGVIAAPIAAYVCNLIRPKNLMFFVGVMISIISMGSILYSLIG